MKPVNKHEIFSFRNPQITAALGGLLLLSAQVAGCGAVTSQKASVAEAAIAGQPIPVQIVEARVGQMSNVLTYSGDVKPKTQVSVSAKGMGRIEELSVDIGSVVSAGQVIGHLDRTALEAQLKQAEAALALANAREAQMEAGTRPETISQAQANLDSAREKLVSMQEGGRQEAVAQAEAAQRLAEARLAELKAGPTREQLAQAEAAVRAAQNNLYAVQAQADAAINLARSGFTREMKEAQAGAAYEQIKVAEGRLAELKAGPKPEQLAQAQAAVDQARAAVELARNPYSEHDVNQAANAVLAAQQQLNLAQNPYTKNDFDLALAPMAQAQANIDFVKAQIADTDIVAPLDGVVAERYLSPGALASPQTAIVLVNSNELEIALSIEESRAGQINVGQRVSLAVAAYPDKTFFGSISTVAPSIDPRTRTFTTKVAVDDPEGKLKAGMFAKVNNNVGERVSALLLPEQVVSRRGTENSVFVVTNDTARIRKVELGASDGKNVEIRSGLEAGDKVIVNSSSLKDGDLVVVAAR